MTSFHSAVNAILRTIIASGGRQRVSSIPTIHTHRWTLSILPNHPRLARPFSLSQVLRATNPQQKGQKGDEKLMELVEMRYLAYQDALKTPPPGDDAEASVTHAKLVRELEPIAEAWKEYTKLSEAIEESHQLLSDPDPSLRSMATEEIEDLNSQLSNLLTQTLPNVLLQPSPTSSLSAILEMKAGVGGDESSLFVEQISRMYIRYANSQGWKCEILSKTPGGGLGGLKEITIKVLGEGAFGRLKNERGVHRVQRVPETESAGRVHTSTIAVVVLPVLEGNQQGSDDLVDEKDVKTEVMRSRGAGGQHVNKTESAVRLTHIPTGISVSMQDSRSQHQNKAWAWQILRARLLDRHLAQQQADKRAARRSQVKGMDRSDKVRTYNFPQDRVTDHRIGLTLSGLEGILEGEGLEYILQELENHQKSLRMESLLESGEDVDE